MAKFDQKHFRNLTSKIKEDMNLSIQTYDELIKFIEENPERYEELTRKVQSAMNDSIVGGTFEELDLTDMHALQGAGDIDGETFRPTIFIPGPTHPITTILYL